MNSTKPIIVYIGSYGRSGSTMLDRVLGEIPGVISLGEIRHIWQRAFRENQWVSKGVPFRECPFWGDVVGRAFGGYDSIDLDAIDRMRASLDRLRGIPKLRQPKRQAEAFIKQLDEFGHILKSLYTSIRDVSGCPILVDSSKHPCYAYLLEASGHFDLRLIHLVRDPRATAYSWLRKRVRPEIYWKEEDMPRFNPATSALHWTMANALLEKLSRDLNTQSVFLRYEDFVSAPSDWILKIWEQFEFPEPVLGFLEGHRLSLGVGRTIAGNPFRFKTGHVDIKPDEEWKDNMPKSSRALVSLLTCYQRKKYSYA